MINFVYGQNVVISNTPTFTTTLLSIDTLTNEEIKSLRLKFCRVYNDSILDLETHYSENGNKIYEKCFNGHICHLDSFFYSKNQCLIKFYDEKNKLQSWSITYKSGKAETSEYYSNTYNLSVFQQINRRELRFKNGKVVYRKSIEYGKTQSIENIKYNKNGVFLESEETHYDYKKDSLVNVTTIKSKKNTITKMTHTNEKYKHYRIDTLTKKHEFDYTDYNEDYVQVFDNHKVIANIVFDGNGNIKASENFVRLEELVVKTINRTYDIKEKTYFENINLLEYYSNGLIKNAGKNNNLYAPYNSYCKYEYY